METAVGLVQPQFHIPLFHSELFLSSLPRTRRVSSGSCRLWIKPMATALGSRSSGAWRL